MKTRIHIHLHAKDIAKSKAFYERFFGIQPVKDYEGYVKFLPDFAPVNLALSSGSSTGDEHGSVSHMGVQVDSSAEVVAHLQRVKAAGLPVREEMSTNCCHANQDKFWVRDPDGVEWEVYHLNYDIDPADERAKALAGRGKLIAVLGGASKETACCSTPS